MIRCVRLMIRIFIKLLINIMSVYRMLRVFAARIALGPAQMARLITPIIDSADLHRSSFRAGDFSQVRNSADSWKQERI